MTGKTCYVNVVECGCGSEKSRMNEKIRCMSGGVLLCNFVHRLKWRLSQYMGDQKSVSEYNRIIRLMAIRLYLLVLE